MLSRKPGLDSETLYKHNSFRIAYKCDCFHAAAALMPLSWDSVRNVSLLLTAPPVFRGWATCSQSSTKKNKRTCKIWVLRFWGRANAAAIQNRAGQCSGGCSAMTLQGTVSSSLCVRVCFDTQTHSSAHRETAVEGDVALYRHLLPSTSHTARASRSYLTRGAEWAIRCLDRFDCQQGGDVLDNSCKWKGDAKALYPTLTGPSLPSCLVLCRSAGFEFFRHFALSQKRLWGGEKLCVCV